LHSALKNGFSRANKPTAREDWRDRSGIPDRDRQLVPLNFFLFSACGVKRDYVLADHLVEVALTRPYNADFAMLSLFTFHLAQSGNWRKSNWPDGRVAGWANELIRSVSDADGTWSSAAFRDAALRGFIADRIDAEDVTTTKIFTNYRYMLRRAGVLDQDTLQPADLRQRWFTDAVQVFWDRQIASGALPASASNRALEEALILAEIQKLLRCDVDQCRTFARAALREYSSKRISEQLNELRKSGAIAA
jgi:hypothetical protein